MRNAYKIINQNESLFFIPFIALIIIDLLYVWNVETGVLGVTLWYLNLAILIVFTIYRFIKLVKFSFKNKVFWTLFTLILIISITVIGSFSSKRPFSTETTQEIDCTIDVLQEDTSFGYHQYCHLGYPVRQFYLPVFPSLIFGNNLFSLSIGSYLYLILGLILFSSLLISHNRKLGQKDKIMAILLVLPFHFFYFNYLYLIPEQALYPISFGFMLVSVATMLVKKPTLMRYLVFAFIQYLLIFSYTTSLAYLPLSFVFSFYLLVRKKQKFIYKAWSWLILIGIFFGFIYSLIIRNDVNFIESNKIIENSISQFINGIKYIFIYSRGYDIISPYIFGILVLGSLLIIFKKFGFLDFIFLLWTLSVIYFSLTMKGYGIPVIPFDFHRAVIIIPVFSGYLLYKISRFGSFNIPHNGLVWVYFLVLFGAILFISSNFPFSINYKHKLAHLEINKFIKDNYPGRNSFLLIDLGYSHYSNLGDSFRYFNQDSTISFTIDPCNEQLTENSDIFIIRSEMSNNECLIEKGVNKTESSQTFIDLGGNEFYVISNQFKE